MPQGIQEDLALLPQWSKTKATTEPVRMKQEMYNFAFGTPVFNYKLNMNLKKKVKRKLELDVIILWMIVTTGDPDLPKEVQDGCSGK